MKHVVIAGGGFGGVYAAMHLGKLLRSVDALDVTVINRENYMVFQPLLPEVISGSIDLLHCITPIRRLCPGAQLISREIEEIDLQRKVVTTAPGFGPRPLEVPYDYLIVALGTVNDFSSMPGLKEHALPFKNMADALLVRNRIIQVLEEAAVEQDPEIRRSLLSFVVTGGGFSGVEVAAEINDFIYEVRKVIRLRSDEKFRVILVHSRDRILPELTPRLGDYARRILERRGVEFFLDDRVTEATADTVVLKSGRKIDARTLISTVPSAPHPLVTALQCAKENGRIITDPTLAMPNLEHHWAVGDCAQIIQPDGTPSPPTAQFAVRQAAVAAANVVASHRGATGRRRFGFSGLGKAGALGRRSAVVEVMGFAVSGLPAWFFWRTLYWWKMPGLDRKIRVGVDWALDLILPRDLVQLKIDPSESFSLEHYEAGDFIFRQGDPGDRMYVIVGGEVEVIIDEGTATERAVARLYAKQYFGEMALFTGTSRSASVRTVTTVDVMSISRSDFESLIGNIPGIKDVFEKEISRRYRELTSAGIIK